MTIVPAGTTTVGSRHVRPSTDARSCPSRCFAISPSRTRTPCFALACSTTAPTFAATAAMFFCLRPLPDRLPVVFGRRLPTPSTSFFPHSTGFLSGSSAWPAQYY
ncbi:hypothetical protein OH76DRAFT_65967 [Lentinus brumalis]|uniref:Uncharacterized protein n=1 Tax=Lentinus brumalis TaxID=2498619 RepID=A0A371DKK3_9APHY|nr:hypothetical protein OH76DRAFT_65967 [Polyporus brumalis]